MLTLPIGRVADPNRTGVRVPGEVRQLDLLKFALAPTPYITWMSPLATHR